MYDELTLLAQRKARPGIYYGEPSLRALRDEMAGRELACSLCGQGDLLKVYCGFMEWYEQRYLPDTGDHAKWWNHLTYLAGGDDRAAFRLFFVRFEAYLAEMGMALPEKTDQDPLPAAGVVAKLCFDELVFLDTVRCNPGCLPCGASFNGLYNFLYGMIQGFHRCGAEDQLPLYRAYVMWYKEENEVARQSVGWKTHLLSRSACSDRQTFYTFFHDMMNYLREHQGIEIPNRAWDWRNMPGADQ